MKRIDSVLIGVTAALFAVGCNPPKSEESPTREEAAPIQQAPAPALSPDVEAKQAFTQRCVACHGNTGEGDGPGAAAIDPKPRAFSDPEWQASVTDDHIKTVIVSGGAAVNKSPLMPGNADLKDKPLVVDELVKIIRGFKK
jgi:mono/diheme cytochrome c family protein